MAKNSAFDIPKPYFPDDLKYGKRGEAVVEQFLKDIGQGSLEVKSDRYRNGRMVLEIEQNPKGRGWKPSGLSVTEAKWWVYQYNLDGAFTIVNVDRARRYIELNKNRLELKLFGVRGDNASRGYLLEPTDVTDLLTNPEYDGVPLDEQAHAD
jgi:hypothetical protein